MNMEDMWHSVNLHNYVIHMMKIRSKVERPSISSKDHFHLLQPPSEMREMVDEMRDHDMTW